jgi:hypothetical protein
MAGKHMDQKIWNKTITIQEISTKQTTGGSKYVLKDHEGRTFNFFTTKKDGDDTSVFAQFKNMELKVGDTVMIGFVEEEFEYQGKNVITKKIINFRETNDQPTQTAPRQESPRTGQNSASGEVIDRLKQGARDVIKNDAFWERQAYEKCCSLWAASELQRDGYTIDSAIQDLQSGHYYRLFQAIKADGAKQFSAMPNGSPVRPAPMPDPDLPSVQVEDIPF